MQQLFFGNLAKTTLAAPISNSATSVTVVSGAALPQIGANQYFVGTLVDALTGAFSEIVWVTALSGNTLTIVRGKEGTAALAWNAGDLFANVWTAGQAASMTPGLAVVPITTGGTTVLSTYLQQLVCLELSVAATVNLVLPAASNFPACPNSPGACPEITIVDVNGTLSPSTPCNITAADSINISGGPSYSKQDAYGSCKIVLIGGSWVIL